jgi:hypothetical protein
MARIAAITALGVALAGCGSAGPARERDAAQTQEVTTSAMSETSGRVVSKTVIWGPGRASGQVVPVRDLYEVFRRAHGDAQAERAARADGYCDRFEDKTGPPPVRGREARLGHSRAGGLRGTDEQRARLRRSLPRRSRRISSTG